MIERKTKAGKTLRVEARIDRLGSEASTWIGATLDGRELLCASVIRSAPKHNFGAEFTHALGGKVLLTQAEAEQLLAEEAVLKAQIAAEPKPEPRPEVALRQRRSALADEYEDACAQVRRSFETENTMAQGPAFARRDAAREALAAWDAAHPEWIAEMKAKRAAEHAQSFVARGLD